MVIFFFKDLGFKRFNANTSILIYYVHKISDITMISIYVDDFLFNSKLCTSLNWIKKNLKNKYNIKGLREVKTIIGWQIIRN